MRREDFYFGVVELKPHGVSKEDRILEAQPYMQFSYFMPGSQLVKRLIDWTPHNGAIDDLPDAFAYQRKMVRAAKKEDEREAPPSNPIHRKLWEDLNGINRIKSPAKLVSIR